MIDAVTALTPGYDHVWPFPDHPSVQRHVFEVLDATEAKRIKCMPRLYLPRATHVLWLDASIEVDDQFVDWHLAHWPHVHGMALYPHPERHNILAEAATCIAYGKAPIAAHDQAASYIQQCPWLSSGPLMMTGVIAYDFIAEPALDELGKRWFAECELWTWRDQISLPYVAWNAGINPRRWPRAENDTWHGINHAVVHPHLEA